MGQEAPHEIQKSQRKSLQIEESVLQSYKVEIDLLGKTSTKKNLGA